jgi:hypothetical protein
MKKAALWHVIHMENITRQVRTVFFWVITQRVVVIPCGRFRTAYYSHHHGSRFIGCPKTLIRNTTTHCVVTHKSAVLIYFVAEARNLPVKCLMCLNGTRNSQKEERMGKTDDVAVWK